MRQDSREGARNVRVSLRRKCIRCYEILGQCTDASSAKANSDFAGNRAEAAERMVKPGKDLVVVICKRSPERKSQKGKRCCRRTRQRKA